MLREVEDGQLVESEDELFQVEEGGQAPGAHGSSAEQETIVRWDQEERKVTFYTAYPHDAAKCFRLGWPLQVEGVMKIRGVKYARGWRAEVDLRCVTFRNIKKTQFNIKDPEAVKRRLNAARKLQGKGRSE